MDLLCHFFDVVPVEFAVVFAAAQGLGVGGGGKGEQGVFVGLVKRFAADGDGLLHQLAVFLSGQFVAHFDKGVFVFAAFGGRGFLIA